MCCLPSILYNTKASSRSPSVCNEISVVGHTLFFKGRLAKSLLERRATFETGKRGRLWATKIPDEKHCLGCIKSVYRSGRMSVIVWAAIGWGWKSPLIFLEVEDGSKEICSKAYLYQVLEACIFLL